MSHAAAWFHGKHILFLIDDIWPTDSRPEGYLPDLELLLQGSPECRIAISTRSTVIAINTGSYVDFGTRDIEGDVAVIIFMSHAVPDAEFGQDHVEAARGVLLRCAGLPMALAVTGKAVALRVAAGLRFQTACEEYFGPAVKCDAFRGTCTGCNYLPQLGFSAELSRNGWENTNAVFFVRNVLQFLCFTKPRTS